MKYYKETVLPRMKTDKDFRDKMNLKQNERARKHRRKYSEKRMIASREIYWRDNGIKNADGSVFKWHDYLNLKILASNKCQICGSLTPGKRDWSADHNHDTGIIRGLLCCACNRALGLMRDNKTIVEKALRYLRGESND